MMHHTQRLAMENGRQAFAAGRPVADSNPYRKSSKSFWSFEAGYREAQRGAA